MQHDNFFFSSSICEVYRKCLQAGLSDMFGGEQLLFIPWIYCVA